MTGNATVTEGDTYTLNIAASGDDLGDVTGYTINWGDGSATEAASLGGNTHDYNDGPLSASIVVTALHPNGNKSSSKSITVTNVVPIATINGAGTATVDVEYTATIGSVTDPGDDTVSTYRVHWGDGSSDDYASAGAKTHTYTAAGSGLTVSLDLVDEDGTHTTVDSYTLDVSAEVLPLFQDDLTDGALISGATVARASTQTVLNYDGAYSSVPANALPISGLNTVENLVRRGASSVSNTLADWGEQATASITLPDQISLPAIDDYVTWGINYDIPIGTQFVCMVRLSAATPGTIQLRLARNSATTYEGPQITLNVTTTPTWFELPYTWTIAHTAFRLDIRRISGDLDDLVFHDYQIQDKTGRDNPTVADPYVSVGVGTKNTDAVSNADFSAWTADDPDDWTVASENGSNYITEHASGARIVSDNTLGVNISQTLAVDTKKSYAVRLTKSNHVAGEIRFQVTGGVTYAAANVSGSDAAGTFEVAIGSPTTSSITVTVYRDNQGAALTDYVLDSIELYECDPGNTGIDGLAYLSVDSLGNSVGPGYLDMQPAATNLADGTHDYSSPDTITLSATGYYTLSVYGTAQVSIAAGTATITGAGAATEGSPVTIDCTATGTVTLTRDSGTLDTLDGSQLIHLEPGTVATNPIPTAGTTASRASTSIDYSVVDTDAVVVDTQPAGCGSDLVISPVDAAHWLAYGTNTETVDGDEITFTYADDDRGGYSYLRKYPDLPTSQLTRDLAVGETVLVVSEAKANNIGPEMLYRVYGDAEIHALTTEWATYASVVTITAGGAPYVNFRTLGAGDTVSVRNVNVYPVSWEARIVASGFADGLLSGDNHDFTSGVGDWAAEQPGNTTVTNAGTWHGEQVGAGIYLGAKIIESASGVATGQTVLITLKVKATVADASRSLRVSVGSAAYKAVTYTSGEWVYVAQTHTFNGLLSNRVIVYLNNSSDAAGDSIEIDDVQIYPIAPANDTERTIDVDSTSATLAVDEVCDHMDVHSVAVYASGERP